jgi:hypothetical protein
MARPLLIANPENATIEELKQVSRVGYNETAPRCTVSFQTTTHILIMDNATWRPRKATHWHRWQPKYLPPYSPDLNPIQRILLTINARWFNNFECKTEEKLLERLD